MADKKSIGAAFIFPTPTDKYTRELTMALKSMADKFEERINFSTRPPYKSVTSAYSVTDNDSIVLADGTFAVTLPSVKPSENRCITVKNTGTGTITVTAQSGENIDGSNTYAMASQYDTVQIISDGTNWHIVSTK